MVLCLFLNNVRASVSSRTNWKHVRSLIEASSICFNRPLIVLPRLIRQVGIVLEVVQLVDLEKHSKVYFNTKFRSNLWNKVTTFCFSVPSPPGLGRTSARPGRIILVGLSRFLLIRQRGLVALDL